jgi:hypothetical protein
MRRLRSRKVLRALHYVGKGSMTSNDTIHFQPYSAGTMQVCHGVSPFASWCSTGTPPNVIVPSSCNGAFYGSKRMCRKPPSSHLIILVEFDVMVNAMGMFRSHRKIGSAIFSKLDLKGSMLRTTPHRRRYRGDLIENLPFVISWKPVHFRHP